MHLAPLHTSLCHLALCKTLVPLALLQPASYALSWDSLHCRSLCRSIRICLYPISQFLLLHIGAPVARSHPRGWVPQGSCPSSLGQSIHITPPPTWRYGCMRSLSPPGSKFPATGGIWMSRCLYSISSQLPLLWLLHNLLKLLHQSWLLHNHLRLLLALHVER